MAAWLGVYNGVLNRNSIRMRLKTLASLPVLACVLLAVTTPAIAGDLLDHSYRPLAGKGQVDLQERYGGDVLLIVNTASKCGYTPQFEALEALHARYQGQGFAVLGFPSGDFRAQEYEDEKQIQTFCTLTYGVRFPMFQKVHVVGEDATPLYRDLAEETGDPPAWNFHKYLVGRDGEVLVSFPSKTAPDDPEVLQAIRLALQAPRPSPANNPAKPDPMRPEGR